MTQYTKIGNIFKIMNEDSKIHNLKQYKAAKMYIEHLEAIALLINTSIRGFTVFEAYQAANECLFTLRAQKVLVEGQINKYKKIIASKGKQ